MQGNITSCCSMPSHTQPQVWQHLAMRHSEEVPPYVRIRDYFGPYRYVRRVSLVIVLGIVPERPFLARCLKFNARVYRIGSCLQCLRSCRHKQEKAMARHFNSMNVWGHSDECSVQRSEAALAQHKCCEGLRYGPCWLNAEKRHSKVAILAGVTAGWH